MHFTRLRLIGFKSFVESTDILVDTGLTGVVGPNGCGKSNLVEALRWVMGESSARQMRGREMDDLIFNGSDLRPKRNHAEVTLLLDNSAGTAPAVFNDSSEIEISRRIERGVGSVYRINGREARARDVQLLFADESTGARSTAMVGQGEIGALIAAKPAKRRGLLEEAAGITGLHSRRHEAELRLRAAETNMERLADVMGGLETQLQGLKRQARQATRYRRIGDHIRRAEALLYGRRWQAALAAVEAAEQAHEAARRSVAERTQDSAAAAADQATAAATLPPLREAEAEAGAALHRLEVAQVELEAEERRLADTRRALEARRAQIDADVEREGGLARDAEEAITRLDEEGAAVSAEQAGETDAERVAGEARDQAVDDVAKLEQEVDSLTRTLAAGEARRGALSREIADLESRLAGLRESADETEVMRAELSAGGERSATLDAAEESVAVAETESAARREQAAAREAERVTLQATEVTAREALQGAETGHAALAAEQAALTEMLGGGDDDAWPALIDEINVEAGMEIALGAALGDDLGASSDLDAPLHWRSQDGKAADLPQGAKPLGDVVSGPPALAWRLSQVGIVEAADGDRLQSQLVQGQRLVSREGALWRWDGLTMAADAASAAATRLRQRNRLKAVADDIGHSEVRRAGAVDALESARAAAAGAAEAEAQSRDALRLAEDAHHKARDARAEAAADAAAEASRLLGLNQDATRIAAELKDGEEQRLATQQSLDGLEPDGDGRATLGALRERLTESRGELSQRLNAYERLRREAAARVERLSKIAADMESWKRRAGGADERLAQLAERRATAAAELDDISGRPAEIDALRGGLLARLEAAQGKRGAAADAVAVAETKLAALDRRMKEAAAALAVSREEGVRAESICEQAGQQRSDVERAVHERLDCAPDALDAIADLKDGEDWPDEANTDVRLSRLIRERDNMGPVNLRAEAEAAEIDEQLTGLTTERADLEAAIARLRQGISRLNREGRERLEAAFEKINGHFSTLFTRLFGGGNAHLSLVGSDDPLEAGLEIMASPPGKRLQVLSLMSGGEQALTALALLFAVFLTNPAPICVLDEVDAPLDDANVARFCDLLEDIARGSSTRFMIITHHRMTMARMDRLFGVTMGERGVSQLVSVDLHATTGMEAAE